MRHHRTCKIVGFAGYWVSWWPNQHGQPVPLGFDPRRYSDPSPSRYTFRLTCNTY